MVFLGRPIHHLNSGVLAVWKFLRHFFGIIWPGYVCKVFDVMQQVVFWIGNAIGQEKHGHNQETYGNVSVNFSLFRAAVARKMKTKLTRGNLWCSQE